MRAHDLAAVCLLLMSACATADGTAVPADLRRRLVGAWVDHGPRTVRGRGNDLVVQIREQGDGLIARFTSIQYPNVGHGDVSVRTSKDLPLRVDGAWLRVEDRAGTFRIEDDRLVFPGLVEETPGTWLFGYREATGERAVEKRFQCETDPRAHPNGAATFPTARPVELAREYPQTFVATVDPSNGTLQRLEFREVDGTGESTRCALCWDEREGLRFEGSGWFLVNEQHFARIDPARDHGLALWCGLSALEAGHE